MTATLPPVVGCVPVVYVTDIGVSLKFYEMLGFVEAAGGRAAEWRWSYLRGGEVGLLLGAGGSVWAAEQGPVLLYLRVSDCEAVEQALRGAGASVEHLGYPDHAPGGELKVVDPDGHGLLIGQVTSRVGGQTGATPAEASQAAGDNVLVRAAEAARRRGHLDHRCQAPSRTGLSCDATAVLKLADSWGDSTWVCLHHAEEIMIDAPGAFIANEDSTGLAAYFRLRRAKP